MSIRTRLAVAVAAVLTATLALVAVVLVRDTRASLVDQVDEQIYASAERSEVVWTRADGGGRGGRGGGDHKAYDQDDRKPPEADPEPAAEATSATTTELDLDERTVARFVYSSTGRLIEGKPCGFEDNPKPPPRLPPIPSLEVDELVDRIVTTPAVDDTLSYRMLVQRGSGGEVVVTAAPLDAADAAVDRLVRILLAVGALALAAATFASWWLIRRGLRPVDRMVNTAAAIAAGDLSRRVPDADPRTELGRLGGALNEMLSQIEGAVQARAAGEARLRRFVADAAHELRTPLTSLRGYAELYRQGALPDPPSVANAMGRIEAEGARMARLVDDLLLLARLDQQRGLERTPVDVVAVVREAAADFAAVEPARPLTRELDGEAIVQGDRTRLRQIVDNLLANARTHTPAGTPVRVAVARRGNQVEFVVADRGSGIAAEDQAHIFERFWRADPARVRGKGGTGLGLAIVASLVQAHGGTVDVRSEPGHGATFTVRLPLAAPVDALE